VYLCDLSATTPLVHVNCCNLNCRASCRAATSCTVTEIKVLPTAQAMRCTMKFVRGLTTEVTKRLIARLGSTRIRQRRNQLLADAIEIVEGPM